MKLLACLAGCFAAAARYIVLFCIAAHSAGLSGLLSLDHTGIGSLVRYPLKCKLYLQTCAGQSYFTGDTIRLGPVCRYVLHISRQVTMARRKKSEEERKVARSLVRAFLCSSIGAALVQPTSAFCRPLPLRKGRDGCNPKEIGRSRFHKQKDGDDSHYDGKETGTSATKRKRRATTRKKGRRRSR